MEGRKITKTKKKMKRNTHTHTKREKIIKENTKQDSFRWVTFVYGLKIICSLTKNEQNRISILSWFCVTKKKKTYDAFRRNFFSVLFCTVNDECIRISMCDQSKSCYKVALATLRSIDFNSFHLILLELKTMKMNDSAFLALSLPTSNI